ncbi:uncharacterized protein LOC144989137 [Oryzias latipes]
MASTPFFFFSGLLFLAWFTADVHSVKVIDVLKGSSVVLRPVEAVTSITSITWKHGDNLAVDWFGGDPTFYNIFNNTCSLNTTTGELTINNVRPEHSGVYTPDINGKTRSAMKLRVLSPVPKPSIIHDCNPEKTKCNLTCTLTCNLTCSDTCKIDTAGDLGDVEVFWILDDSRVNGSELQITEDTKTETFICSLKNSVSSENSAKLLNPLLPSVPVWIIVVWTLVPLASIALLAFVCWKWIYPKYGRYRIKKIIKEIQETKMSEEHDRIIKEIGAAGPVPDEDRALLDADEVILRILNQVKKLKLSEDSILMLLNARYVILWILQQGPQVKKSPDKVKDLMQMFHKGRNKLKQYKDKGPTLLDVRQGIFKILSKKEKLNLSADDFNNLLDVAQKISTIIVKKERIMDQERRSTNDEERVRSYGLARRISDITSSALPYRDIDQKLKDVQQRIWGILRDKNALKLSADDYQALLDVQKRISTMIINKRDVRRVDEEKEQGSLNGRPEAADPLISSSRFEAVVPV